MDKHTPAQLQKTAKGPTPLDVRLLRRREVTADGCWNYLGTKNSKGYAKTTVGSLSDGSRRVRYVHALAYELWVGQVPDGLELDHLCRNAACFNPEHLEAVTHYENMRRRDAYRLDTCRRGHKHTPESTYVTTTGYTRCKTCRNLLRASTKGT